MAAIGDTAGAARGGLLCVTGGSGFIGSWLVRRLLDRGYTVHATVKNLQDEGETKHLLGMDGADTRLRLFQMDLLDPASIQAAVEGARGVFHVAQPLHAELMICCVLDCSQKELLEPAVKGTLSVLRAAKDSGVSRVVLMSSQAAMIPNPNWPADKVIDEDSWSDVELFKKLEFWYGVSKTMAETAAWEFAAKEGLQLVVLNPGMVLGPMLTPTVNVSLHLLLQVLEGKRIDLDDVYMGCVDVRDVAHSLMVLYENPSARGRHLCMESVDRMIDFTNKVADLYPELPVQRIQEDKQDWVVRAKDPSKKLINLGDSDGGGIGRDGEGSGLRIKELFPVRKKAFIQLLKATSNVIATTVTGLSIFAATIPLSWKNVKPLATGEKALLISLPFIFVPLAMMVVGWTHVAEYQYNLLPFAAGLVLSVACSVLLLVWSVLFKYPKILARMRIYNKLGKAATEREESDSNIQPVHEPVTSSVIIVILSNIALSFVRKLPPPFDANVVNSVSKVIIEFMVLPIDSDSDDRKRRRGCYTEKMFPIRNKALVHASKAVSNTCISTVTAVNIFAASVPHLCEKEFKHLTTRMKSLLLALPFIFLPIGVVTVCFTHAAEHQRNLLSAAKVMVVCEFIYSLGLLTAITVIFEILPEDVTWAFLVIVLMTIRRFICKNAQTRKLLQVLSLLALAPLVVKDLRGKVAWVTTVIVVVTIWSFACEGTQDKKLPHEVSSKWLWAAKALPSVPQDADTASLLHLSEIEATATASAEKEGAVAAAKAEAEAAAARAKAEVAAAKAKTEAKAGVEATASLPLPASIGMPPLPEGSRDVILDIDQISELDK
ncbi:hypothetical protein EJB05_18625 [Eragrostis curvula]|uniref:NAD-dependent epimerase/dehydratase domain-containing protein n=1 Tax=Eragrostis curvula TaxID=38414 RepID=A0A5J9VM68_9POAL|nr:hypothetical protein EJB05_18625 [Eragrostis curvula]